MQSILGICIVNNYVVITDDARLKQEGRQTYTMVPCMKEIKELFSAVLLCGRARADPGLTLLQALLGVDTMLHILTLLPH